MTAASKKHPWKHSQTSVCPVRVCFRLTTFFTKVFQECTSVMFSRDTLAHSFFIVPRAGLEPAFATPFTDPPFVAETGYLGKLVAF